MKKYQGPHLRLICDRKRGPADGMGNYKGNDPYLYGEKVKAYLRKRCKGTAGSLEVSGWGMGGCA